MPHPIPPPRASGYTAATPVPLYWATYGPVGAPRLLVLHGGPGAHHDYLLPQMLRLAASHELVFYDQRGGGRSRTEDRAPITARTHVEDLAAVVSELACEPLTIVGYSWGGLLALLYTIETTPEPSAVGPPPRRLVLIDPAPVTRALRSRFESDFAARQRNPAFERERAELATSGLRERDPDAYRQRLFELSVAGYFYRAELARDLTPFRVIARVQQSVWQSLGQYDVLARLGPVCPTLVVHGEQDPIPVESSVVVARALAARLVVLAECGHVPYVEQPDGLFSAIDRFLEETAPGTQ
jgi:proline iminopeptidase